jgi:2-C-methyl-D-erythritol 4-phosphate cytidylyltransferase/2-C-methyl-D-erythritol 2,4-cyclodiphosphate synthase
VSTAAIIVAAGRGLRLGGETPKQLRSIGQATMLQRSVGAFDRHAAVEHIIVVLPPELVDRGSALVGGTAHPCRFVAGGLRRQDSVSRGVQALPTGVDRILVHDAARPFVPAAVIDRVLEGLAGHSVVVPAVPVRDTVKRVDRDSSTVVATLPREEIWLAQTPQGFRAAVLAELIAQGDSAAEATDEAMLAERAGHRIHVVTGDDTNVKITTAGDLASARARVAGAVRVGTGYDLHRLGAERPLLLAGVRVSEARGPIAHSDGDVLCHAIVDAILGAAGAGDIGRHFPNSDPRWKDAPGLALLGRAVAIVGDLGFDVLQADATIILERPKLAPYIEAMQDAVRAVVGVAAGHVSVKAKTNEGVDAVGRGEAIVAHAVAVLGPRE